MKRSTALFLQVVVLLFGLGVLALLLWEPHLEGRNARATPFEIYFNDPFLAYVYVGSTPFFVAVYRAFALLGHLKRNAVCSPVTVDALRAIQRCALALVGFVAGAVVFILVFGDGEDRPAGVFMCLLAAVACGVMAGVAALLARNVQNNLSGLDRRAGRRPA